MAPEAIPQEDPRFAGVSRVLGRSATSALAGAHVAVVGLGGVGSWAVEALARTGVGRLSLVDLDDVCVSNTNRQVHALAGQFGRPKADVLAERVRKIHPGCDVQAHLRWCNQQSVAELLAGTDAVIDAIDRLRDKCHLLEHCRLHRLNVVTIGGAGGKRHATAARVTDLAQTRHDGLLQKCRKRLRQKHGFPRRGLFGIPAVYSEERPSYPGSDGEPCLHREADRPAAARLDCEGGFGALMHVTATFAMLAVEVCVAQLLTPTAQGSVGIGSAASEVPFDGPS